MIDLRTIRTAPVVVALLLLSFTVGFERWHTIEPVPLGRDLKTVPHRIGRWQSLIGGSFPSDLEPLEFDAKLSRNYSASDSGELNLFIGYFGRQAQGRELAGYATRTLFADKQSVSYRIPDTGGASVRDFVYAAGGTTFHVTYWYVLNGRVVSADAEAKLYTGWDAIVHARTNGALVAVKARVQPPGDLRAARLNVADFVSDALALLRLYLSND